MSDITPTQHEKDLAYWRGRVDTELADKVAYHRQVDSLQHSLVARARTDSIKTDSIAALQTPLRTRRNAVLRPTVASLPDTCKPVVEELLAQADSLDAALTSARKIIERQRSAIASLSRTVDMLQVEADTLELLLRAVPTHKPDRLFGFIPLPSRTTSLVMGAAAGIVGTVLVLK